MHLVFVEINYCSYKSYKMFRVLSENDQNFFRFIWISELIELWMKIDENIQKLFIYTWKFECIVKISIRIFF